MISNGQQLGCSYEQPTQGYSIIVFLSTARRNWGTAQASVKRTPPVNCATGTLLGNVTAEPIDTGVVEAATAAVTENDAEIDVAFDVLEKLVILHPRLEETVIPTELQRFELYVTATADLHVSFENASTSKGSTHGFDHSKQYNLTKCNTGMSFCILNRYTGISCLRLNSCW